MTEDTSVRRATAADRSRIVSVLAEAFADDPVMGHLLPPGSRRREQRIRRLFALELPRSERLGGAWIAGRGAGAAVWYPPGQWRPSSWQVLRQAPAAVRLFGRQAGRAARTQDLLHEHHPERPHWYLYYLGTERQQRGTGIGSALMRPVLESCDQQGLPAYLEATTQHSRAFYLRHGFQELEPVNLPDDGPPLYPMWRDPR